MRNNIVNKLRKLRIIKKKLWVEHEWLFKRLGLTFTCARYNLPPLLKGISLRCHTMRAHGRLEKLEDLWAT